VGISLSGGGDWARLLARAERAEALGLHSLWIPESHFHPGASASPLVVLSAVATRTRRLRLATTSLLLPIQHPLRVAADVAVLDVLSNGRVVLGVGRGFRAPLFEGFGVSPGDKRDRFEESLDACLRAWSGEPLTLEGEHFASAAGEAVRLSLRPVQRPHPPLVVAAFGPKGLLQAARRGLPYLASPLESLATLEENYALWRAHLPAGATCAGNGAPSVPVMRSVFVARDEDEARRVRDLLAAETARLRGAGPAASAALARAAGGSLEERALVGTAPAVAEGIARYRERLGMDLLVARFEVAGVAPEDCDASLTRLAEEVLPALG
jgi:alkanesulfonate monooxygenase SsuD/methylene tetrahydromethanopterin reductase-like flavin-dependent oxidoreductase (luciferase family)